MVPELFQVIAQRQQLLALLAVSSGAKALASSKRRSISVTHEIVTVSWGPTTARNCLTTPRILGDNPGSIQLICG
jgi:hypothetical protein